MSGSPESRTVLTRASETREVSVAIVAVPVPVTDPPPGPAAVAVAVLTTLPFATSATVTV